MTSKRMAAIAIALATAAFVGGPGLAQAEPPTGTTPIFQKNYSDPLAGSGTYCTIKVFQWTTKHLLKGTQYLGSELICQGFFLPKSKTAMVTMSRTEPACDYVITGCATWSTEKTLSSGSYAYGNRIYVETSRGCRYRTGSGKFSYSARFMVYSTHLKGGKAIEIYTDARSDYLDPPNSPRQNWVPRTFTSKCYNNS